MFGLPGRVVDATGSGRDVVLRRAPADLGLLAAWRKGAGAPAGVADVLDDLDRRARPARTPLTRTAAAFRWDEADVRTTAWVPQGVTTSADARPQGLVHGRSVVAVSWYRRTAAGPDQGARVTFTDTTDPADVRYRHVLLVEAVHDPRTDRPVIAPVPVHAGGIVWYGDLLYVAATYAGLRVFDLTDLVRVESAGHDGYAYLLPQRWAYEPVGAPESPMRFSFVSLDRTSSTLDAMPSLLAGEYGLGDAPTQIIRFALDDAGAFREDADSRVLPTESFALDVLSMQGVACVEQTFFVTSSNGRSGRGHLWVGGPSAGFRRHRGVLPAGVEDLSAWPERGQLWSLTEWAGRRVVFALRTADWLGS